MHRYKRFFPRRKRFKLQNVLRLYQQSNFLIEPLWGVQPKLMPHLNYVAVLTQLNEIMKQFPKKSEILIINGNQGFIALHLANLGHKITILEPHNNKLINSLRKISKKEKSIDVIKWENPTKIPYLSNQFDLIVCAGTFLYLSQNHGEDQAKQIFIETYNRFNYVLSMELGLDSHKWWRQYLENIKIAGDFTKKYLGISINNRIQPINLTLISKSNPRKLTIFDSEPMNLLKKTYENDGRNSHISIYESSTKIYKVIAGEKNSIASAEIEKLQIDQIHPQIRQKLNLPELKLTENEAGQLVVTRKRFQGETVYDSVGAHLENVENFVALMCSYSKYGYFHNDLRPWNVLIDKNQVNLVDFENLSTLDQDPSGYPQWIPMLAVCNYLSQGPAKTWKLEELAQCSKQHIDYRHPASQIYYEKSWYLLNKNKKRVLRLNFLNVEQTVVEFLQILDGNFTSIQKYWSVGRYGVQ